MRLFLLLLTLACTLSSCDPTKKLIDLSNYSWEKASSGTTVKLKPKTYYLDLPIVINDKENITIDGNGATFIMNLPENNVLEVNNSKNITLKNFKATHLQASGPTGCTGNVIRIMDGADILIEKCDLNGSGVVGIAAYGSSNLRVLNCNIHENSEYGIIYQGPSIEIIGNTFEKNKLGNLYFSYNKTNWPPDFLINTDENQEGLKMKDNVYK